MTTRTAVAIYARISEDRTGEELGVKRQLADCRAEARRRGWTVAEEYVDDDVSAYSGKPRPRYQQMLADIAERRRDAVIVWHLDRLHRQPRELEQFADTCAAAGLHDVVTLHGDINLANGDGLLQARIMAAVAANESDAKSRRQRRKAQEIAENGRPNMGGNLRPFGFTADRITHDLTEAQVIRDLAARALAGESLRSLTVWLHQQGIPSVSGKPWRILTVRHILTSPRICGLRELRGRIVGPAAWEPIISPKDGERLRRRLLDPARKTTRAPRRYLLTGLLTCGRCGEPLSATPKDGKRRYGCRRLPDRGCGRLQIMADPLEQFIADAVLYRLDTPDVHAALAASPEADDRARDLADAIETDARRLTDLAEMWADGQLTRAEWVAARTRIEPRLKTNRRALASLTGRAAAADYIGHGDELRASWDGLDLSRQIAVVRAMLASATILPAVPGRQRLDPARIVPTWRV